jgi:C-terminal processing protease CtpA/Prc
MHSKLYILTLIIITLFTACQEVQSQNNSKNDLSITSLNTDISCQEMETKNKIFNNKNTLKIKPLQDIKLLIQDDAPLHKTLSFNPQELYKLFQTEYYWASLVSRNFDYTLYEKPQEFINKIRYKKDRWSFAITVKEYSDVTSQKSVGIGIRCQDFKSGCLITYVRIDSPADRIDLRRGDLITKVNGKNVTEEEFYKEVKREKKINLELIRKSTQEHCIGSITPYEYTYKVLESKTLKTINNEKVAYLRLDSFLGEKNIKEPLNNAFNEFKRENIQKLIIDLRYNGGGSVELASELLNKLLTDYQDEEQFTLAWNSEYISKNRTYRFNKQNNSLNLKQIIFLTTQNSASASELVISAMKPYLPKSDVVVIGAKTHGKPVGMEGRKDRNYYYFLINFVVKNSLGIYDYFEGIPVTKGCNVVDDPFYEMGDPNEKMLKTALHYINEGSCQ